MPAHDSIERERPRQAGWRNARGAQRAGWGGIPGCLLLPVLMAMTLSSAAIAEPPAGYTPERACTDCHGDLTKKPHVHPVIAEDGCAACHFDDGEHVFEPVEPAPDGCLVCHDDGEQTWVHGEGAATCTDCHDPHASRNRRMLLEPARQLCSTCHDIGQDSEAASVHRPVKQGRCLACHHPHQNTATPLLRKPIAQTCPQCHAAITRPRGLDPGIHIQLDDGGGCMMCHAPHESAERKLLLERFSGTPHTTDLERDAALCFTCHDRESLFDPESTGFRAEDGRSLHAVHLQAPGLGRNCRACHTMHLPGPSHLVGGGWRMGSWNAPLSWVREGNHASCAPACHEPRSYPTSP